MSAPPDDGRTTDDLGDEEELDEADEIDEASEESFPASDAPANWAGPAGG
ncbi:MAG TPA: hypothetical protein VKR22_02850 [Acidimicrobiales bacterium]|nr:hypothetical protein [Acidimicrobiales bacterium]